MMSSSGPTPIWAASPSLTTKFCRWISEVHRFALTQLAERGDTLSRVAEYYQVRLAIVAAADQQDRHDTGPCRAHSDEELPTGRSDSGE